MKNEYLVFYSNKLYGRYPAPALPIRRWHHNYPRDLPDGAYILTPDDTWFRSDYTPVLPEHVPKELLAWQLILT